MVDVVGADSAANELLENVVILVADARRGDAADRVGAVLCFNFIEAPGDIGDRLVPLASSSGASLRRRMSGFVRRSGCWMKSIPNRPLTHRLPELAGPFAEPLTATILLPSVSISIAQPVPQKQHTPSVFSLIRLGLQAGIGQVLDRACWAHADTLAAIVALGVTEVRGAAYERWIALGAGGVDVAVLHGAANTHATMTSNALFAIEYEKWR